MPQRSVATNYTFEQQRTEINLLAADFWSQKGTVDTAASTYLKHDGSNDFTGGTLNVPNAFTINSNSGAGTLTISGNLNVTGTTTTVNTTNLDVTDKNITIAKGNAQDATADGAGITIDSATDITWNFVDAKDAWVSSIGVEATTFLKGPYGQFTGSGTPTTGQGVEVNAPDANTGQIASYDRGGSAYKELRIKGSSVGIYGGTTNTLAGTFNSTGLSMESGKSIACGTVVSTMTSPDPFNTVQTNLTLVNGAGNQGAGSKIDFTCGNGKAHIQSLVTGGNSDSGLALVFATSPDNAGADERLRITSDGAIGIGNLQSNQNTVTQSSSTKLYIDSTKFTKIARLGAGSIGSAAWYTVAKISSAQGNHFKCYVSIGGNFTQDMCVMELTGSWSASGGLSNTYTEPVFTAHRTGAHSTDRITKARFAKDSSNLTFFQIYIAGGVDSNTFGKSVLEYQIGTYSQNTADSGSEAMFAVVGTPLTAIRTLEFTDNALCTNAGSHRIYTGGSERLRINPTGDVILGFEGNSLYFNNGFNDSNARIQNAGATNNSNLRFLTRNAGTEVERFRIESDGKIYVGGSGASATAGELWFNDTSAYSSYIKQIAGSSALSFHTGQSQPERLRIGSDGTISKYHNATDIAAAFGGAGQVNGVTALPSMAGVPFVVAKDTGSLRSATFAGKVETGPVIVKGDNSATSRFQVQTTNSSPDLRLHTWNDASGMYAMLGVNDYLDANGNNASATADKKSASIFLDGRQGKVFLRTKHDSGTAPLDRLMISSTGLIGINQTGPASTLHVDNKSTGTTEADKRIAGFYKPSASDGTDREGYIHLGSWSGHYGVKLGYYNEGASPGYHNSGFFISTINSNQDITNHTKKFIVTSDGLVGINRDPVYSGLFGGSQKGIHIGGTTAPFLRITSDTSSQGDLILQAGNSGGDVQIGNLNAGGDIVFWNNSDGGTLAETARIASAGLVTAKAFYPTYGSTGFRNLWYNGNMSVAQRLYLKDVTSASGDGYQSIDRYYTHQSGGAMSVSQELLGPGDDIEGSTYFMRVTTSSASDYSVMRLPIEDVRTIDGGEPITVSFWAKYVTNAPNGGLAMWFQTNYGENGSSNGTTAQQYFNGQNNMPQLTTSWAKYSITFTDFPTLSGKTIGAGSHVEFLFGQGVNSGSTAWTLDITNIQIERGYHATPFERVDPALNLLRCQRYFHGERYEPQRDSESSMASEYLLTTGVGYTTTRVLAHLYWPTTMRARPFDLYSGANAFQVLSSGGSWTDSNTVNIRASRYGARLDINTSSNFTSNAGDSVEVRIPSGRWFGVSAELPIAVNSSTGGVYS